jgi:hypothetical protein
MAVKLGYVVLGTGFQGTWLPRPELNSYQEQI